MNQTFGAAINSSGELWTWGRNADGQLGLGNTTDICVPAQVGTLTNWKYIECGWNSMCAVKTDGTMWNWGSINEGNARNDESQPNSPVQIGSATTWIAPVSGVDPQSCFASHNS